MPRGDCHPTSDVVPTVVRERRQGPCHGPGPWRLSVLRVLCGRSSEVGHIGRNSGTFDVDFESGGARAIYLDIEILGIETMPMPTHDLIDRLRSEWKGERPRLDTSSMEVVGRLLILGEHLRREADEVLAPFGLGYSDFGVLATLRRSGTPYELRPAELCRTVLLQSGSMTACLDRLEGRGLVTRAPDPRDRRARLVRLTDAGGDLVVETLELRLTAAEDFLASMSAGDRNALASLLRQLVLEHRPLEPSP